MTPLQKDVQSSYVGENTLKTEFFNTPFRKSLVSERKVERFLD